MNHRLKYFQERCSQNRFLWFDQNDYLPDMYAQLTEEEWQIMVYFFEETERRQFIGECSIPMMSEMLGFVQGNNLDRIVQCGHYAGWSSLLIGWTLRRMGKTHALYSIDIDPEVTKFTNTMIQISGLSNIVHLEVADSSDPDMPESAEQYLQSDPKMIFIDSSHQYEHTLKELDLWYPVLQKGGLIFMHDISVFAQEFDTTKKGGVHMALLKWISLNNPSWFGLNNYIEGGEKLVRQDGCGAGIIQK